VRLFCFPYAGGGAGSFRGWADELPMEIELFAVQPPGREDRMFEDQVDDLDTAVDAVVGELLAYTDLPFALFGHSLGAIVCWEVAGRLVERHGIAPDDLLISGCRALPAIHDGRRDLHDLTDPELIGELRKLNGTPREVLDHPELIGMLLPAIRADYRMLSRYRYSPRAPVGSTVSVFGGDADPAVALPHLYRWAELVEGELDVSVLPGDHFFLNSSRTPLLKEVSARLARHTGARPGRTRERVHE
jgi:medium-chain acyl-[acyl-carrier-protein] hydrolase